METIQKKNILILLVLLFVIIGAFFYYLSYRPAALRREATRQYRKILQDYYVTSTSGEDFLKTADRIEKLLTDHQGNLSLEEEGYAKIVLGFSTTIKDRALGINILKEVIQNEPYPPAVRAFAINTLVDDYELNFTDRDFAKNVTFAGSLEDVFIRAGKDEKVAIRLLNEQSAALSPNVIAHYRVALWYASELYKRRPVSGQGKNELEQKMKDALAAGDPLLSEQSRVHRQGLSYALKARAWYLAGEDKNEVEKLFNLAEEKLMQPPLGMFQIIYMTHPGFYHGAFLARAFGESRKEEIRALLKEYYDYFITPQPRERRNIRFASFLVAARDSKDADYPAPDFNREDIKRISALYPELGAVIQGLDLEKYRTAP